MGGGGVEFFFERKLSSLEWESGVEMQKDRFFFFHILLRNMIVI